MNALRAKRQNLSPRPMVCSVFRLFLPLITRGLTISGLLRRARTSYIPTPGQSGQVHPAFLDRLFTEQLHGEPADDR
jgi:hypothetical protein